MSGYLNAPELNRSAFVDGWFRTGDIGSIDKDGFLSLHGRQKELINRGGEKIAPLEIDNALMRHPDVAQAAAYAVPHPRLGEDVAAAVVLRPGSKITPDELREFLGKQLAPYKNPRRITIVDQLPKEITGKVQRKRLSESAEGPSEAALAEARLHADLLQLWKKFLKTDNVSIDDDFFEKGGNSLLAMELHLAIQQLTGQTLSKSLSRSGNRSRAGKEAVSLGGLASITPSGVLGARMPRSIQAIGRRRLANSKRSAAITASIGRTAPVAENRGNTARFRCASPRTPTHAVYEPRLQLDR